MEMSGQTGEIEKTEKIEKISSFVQLTADVKRVGAKVNLVHKSEDILFKQ